jgi:hypothetical protein
VLFDNTKVWKGREKVRRGTLFIISFVASYMLQTGVGTRMDDSKKIVKKSGIRSKNIRAQYQEIVIRK